ncbi:hypothetical protein FACS1894181_16120 [Bacteroidia bacterium]|nr:hypothetical protein FACS1894181_16120 [Bacteroidia bacterium]
MLGYGFEVAPAASSGGKHRLVASAKSLKTMKQKLKEITRKTRPFSFDSRVRMLGEVQCGWLQYFCLARMYWQVDKLDKWVRSRLRYCIWHAWKKPEGRRKNLLRLGVKPSNVRSWSRTRMGGWATALSPILKTTITIARLQKRGYEAMLPLYQSIAPYLNEPLYTRPVRTVV